jgi:hypothetical protein
VLDPTTTFLGGQTVWLHRHLNAWNTFIRQQLNDINKGMCISHFISYNVVFVLTSFPGLSKGDHWKLMEFIESHIETLSNDYARLSRAQKNKYETEIMVMRANK